MMVRLIAVKFVVLLTLCMAQAHAQEEYQPLQKQVLVNWLFRFQELNSNKSQDGELSYPLVRHLNALNMMIRTRQDIATFRNWEKAAEIVSALIPSAAGPRAETRIPATLVLGNVVDNATVCHVIGYLVRRKDIDVDGQYNLLQVVRQVADYAFVDTAAWIAKLVEIKKSELGEKESVGNTRSLLMRISASLRKRMDEDFRTLKDVDKGTFDKCVNVLPTEFSSVADRLATLTIDVIRTRLFSNERKDFAKDFAQLYDQASESDRVRLVDALIAAIIPAKMDPERRYRINLYIAVTFIDMAAGALKTSAQREAFLALKDTPEYREDQTFKDRVNDAIRRQGL